MSQPASDRFAEIALELNAMVRRDQAMRSGGCFDPKIDAANTLRLKEIVAEIGWPIRSTVGEAASDQAWLLVQHADLDLNFQKWALSAMKNCQPGEIKLSNIAYLEDRVCIAEGGPQIYGTQGFVAESGWHPHPIKNECEVDSRRAAMGLESLSAYIEQCNNFYSDNFKLQG